MLLFPVFSYISQVDERRNDTVLHCKKSYEIPGFILTNLPGTGIGYIIPGQGEFGK